MASRSSLCHGSEKAAVYKPGWELSSEATMPGTLISTSRTGRNEFLPPSLWSYVSTAGAHWQPPVVQPFEFYQRAGPPAPGHSVWWAISPFLLLFGFSRPSDSSSFFRKLLSPASLEFTLLPLVLLDLAQSTSHLSNRLVYTDTCSHDSASLSRAGDQVSFFHAQSLRLVTLSFSQNPICRSRQNWFSKHNGLFTVTSTSVSSTWQTTTKVGRTLT